MTNAPGWLPDPTDAGRWRWWDGRTWTDSVARDGVTTLDPITASPADRRSARTAGKRRLPAWAWALIGLIGLVLSIFLAPVVAVVALIVLITGIIALANGSPTWLRLRTRKLAIGITAASAAVLLLSGSVSAAVLPTSMRDRQVGQAAPFAASASASPTAQEPSPTRTPTPTATPTPVQTTRQEVVTEAIPFERTSIDDGSRPRGEAAITTSGQDGERTRTYTVTMIDGKEVAREVASETVTRQPISEVTSVGTYDPPPPPAPEPAAPEQAAPEEPGQCDPNYADACVPIASDVDCAGGSGNGPAYLAETARVVGEDIYDLDRDGDGLACE